MSEPLSSSGGDARVALVDTADALRPALHRYAARLMGSVIDGEDVVQDTLERALAALDGLDPATPLRPWLFRIAHNRALDLLRGRAVRDAEPLDVALNLADPSTPDPEQMLMRRQAVTTAVSRFIELPIHQRSVVVLKDVLGESLSDIAVLLDLTVDAVKSHLARGRTRLRELNTQPPATTPASVPAQQPSAAVLHYVALFNQRDWDGLRALLADDVKLRQSSHPLRVGRADVGLFFTLYARSPHVWLAPARLDGGEVIAVYADRADAQPAYLMWLAWRDGRIVFIRDYRHVSYLMADAQVVVS